MDSPILHIVRPSIAAPNAGTSSAALKVNIQAAAMLQLVENINNSVQGKRVIGTLVGSRSEDGSILTVKESYIVPHQEEEDEVSIEGQHHRSLYALHKRSSPSDSILGWFATSPDFNSYTGLVHDFYSRQEGSYPYPAIHLTIQTRNEKDELISPIFRTFVGSAIGASPALAHQLGLEKSGSYIFTPIPNEVVYGSAQKSTLSWIASGSKTPPSQIGQLQDQLAKTQLLVEKTQKYVERVVSGEIEGDEQVGKELLSFLGTKPCSENLECIFNSHLQDTLMVEYLANSVKTQLGLNAKLMELVIGDK